MEILEIYINKWKRKKYKIQLKKYLRLFNKIIYELKTRILIINLYTVNMNLKIIVKK